MSFSQFTDEDVKELRRENFVLHDTIAVLKHELYLQRMEKQEFTKRFQALQEQLQQLKLQHASPNRMSAITLSQVGESSGNTPTRQQTTSRSNQKSQRGSDNEYTVGQLYPDITTNPIVKYVLKKRRSVQSNVDTVTTDRESQRSKNDGNKLRTLRQIMRSKLTNQEQSPKKPSDCVFAPTGKRRLSFFEKGLE